MRTEITRTYKSGFVLTEQELRRIIQACADHAAKVSGAAPLPTSIEAVLRDGAIIECDSADDLFALENIGSKRIQKVSVVFGGAGENVPWQIAIKFQDGLLNTKDWTSVSFYVTGASRDWAFVAASDLEDRIKRIKSLAFEALLSSKWMMMWFMGLTMVVLTFVTTYLTPARQTHLLLQQQYNSGRLKDPIQALIALERIRNESSTSAPLLPLVGFFVPLGILLLLSVAMPKLRPSYNFVWGDYVVYFERRKQIAKVVWTVVILGLVVSVVANVLTRKLGL